MALDVTPGGASSDSYVTLSEYLAYADLYGWVLHGAADKKEADLRRARAYLDRSYNWAGYRVSVEQALEFPRYVGRNVRGFSVPSDIVPKDIKDAQCEMAYLIQGGADPFATITNGAVAARREKVDVLEISESYSASTSRDRPAYLSVDHIVAPYVDGKVGQMTGSISLARS